MSWIQSWLPKSMTDAVGRSPPAAVGFRRRSPRNRSPKQAVVKQEEGATPPSPPLSRGEARREASIDDAPSAKKSRAASGGAETPAGAAEGSSSKKSAVGSAAPSRILSANPVVCDLISHGSEEGPEKETAKVGGDLDYAKKGEVKIKQEGVVEETPEKKTKKKKKKSGTPSRVLSTDPVICDLISRGSKEGPEKETSKVEGDFDAAEKEGGKIKHEEAVEETPQKKEKKKKKNSGNSDECFICDEGGHLICCDFCDKSFHMSCHVPPLREIPKGKWKCCECAASSYTRRFKCGHCEACLRPDCGKCMFCLDKPKFGGVGSLKQVCVHKICPDKRYAPSAAVTPEAKEKMSRHKAGESEGRALGVASEEAGTPLAGVSSTPGRADAPAMPHKRGRKPPARSREAAIGEKAPKAPEDASAKPAAAVEVSTEEDADAFSTVTVPFSPPDHRAGGGAGDAAGNDNDASDDLLLCRMELKRARAENARQADEIKRLKSAVRALTASLTG